jgi:membrane protein DedA with SNARE-associated domain
MIEVVIEFVRDNEVWAAPSVFGLAFLESFAFLSLIVPATAILFGAGALIGAAGLGFVPLYSRRSQEPSSEIGLPSSWRSG